LAALLLLSACDCGDDHPARRDGCVFGAGALPAQTLGPTEPHGTQIPIDHFVIVMQENRSPHPARTRATAAISSTFIVEPGQVGLGIAQRPAMHTSLP
jgi:phospholipase C